MKLLGHISLSICKYIFKMEKRGKTPSNKKNHLKAHHLKKKNIQSKNLTLPYFSPRARQPHLATCYDSSRLSLCYAEFKKVEQPLKVTVRSEIVPSVE